MIEIATLVSLVGFFICILFLIVEITSLLISAINKAFRYLLFEDEEPKATRNELLYQTFREYTK